MSLLGYFLLSWALFNVLFTACFLYPVAMPRPPRTAPTTPRVEL
jgi:hypothetical protein